MKELEKEAEEYADKFWGASPSTMKALAEAYAKGAESRAKLEKENAELKVRIGLSIDCEKAHKDGELCLGYGGDEDEPCEQCKNCIKCECGYYQLGETEKDVQLTKAKELIEELASSLSVVGECEEEECELLNRAAQFLNSEVEKCSN